MTFQLEYHRVVKRGVNRSSQRSIPALLALLGTLLLTFFVSESFAQFSANSSGSAHSVSVAPPTGSIAPHTGSIAPPTGASPLHNGNVTFNSGIGHPTNPHFPGSSNTGVHHHPHHSANGAAYYYPYVYGVPVPYAADNSDADADSSDDDDAEYQGGPTVFDRRGSGPASYVPPSYVGPAHQADASSGADPVPESPQSPTTLVFKDGHQLEVENYAIVAQTLYDLTPGHPRKIALVDLDLPATEKQNDDRGVTFQLPPSAQGN
jgi:hypothetical protein